MAINRFDEYKAASILTMTPGELIILLYDEALISINGAVYQIEKKNFSKAHEQIMRAEKIVLHLMENLNMSYPISEQLMKIYEFVHAQLVEANVKKDTALLKTIAGMLSDLRDTWKQAQTELRRGQSRAVSGI